MVGCGGWLRLSSCLCLPCGNMNCEHVAAAAKLALEKQIAEEKRRRVEAEKAKQAEQFDAKLEEEKIKLEKVHSVILTSRAGGEGHSQIRRGAHMRARIPFATIHNMARLAHVCSLDCRSSRGRQARWPRS